MDKGLMDESNVIEIVPAVSLERFCKHRCLDNSDCTYYTYYMGDSLEFSNVCVLLKKRIQPKRFFIT